MENLNKPPSAPLAAQYLIQHKCIFTSENAARMCGEPVVDHPYYCKVHAQVQKIRDMLVVGLAEIALRDTTKVDPVKPVVIEAGSPGWW